MPVGLLACLVALLLLAPPAHANGGVVLTVSPLRLEVVADPGATVTRNVKVKNSGTAPLDLAFQPQDFTASGESGQPAFLPSSPTAQSLSGWMTAKPATFRLRPGQEQAVRLTIVVPKKGEPGGHYAAALFGSSSTSKKQTAVVAKVGTLLLLTVNGAIKEDLAVSLAAPRVLEGGPVDFGVRAENSGNVHVKPEGIVVVDPVLWGDEKAVPVPAENVLPRSARQATVRLDELPLGLYRAVAKVTYGQTKTAAASESRLFLVVPWKTVLAGVAIFLLGIVAAVGLGRLFGRRRDVTKQA